MSTDVSQETGLASNRQQLQCAQVQCRKPSKDVTEGAHTEHVDMLLMHDEAVPSCCVPEIEGGAHHCAIVPEMVNMRNWPNRNTVHSMVTLAKDMYVGTQPSACHAQQGTDCPCASLHWCPDTCVRSAAPKHSLMLSAVAHVRKQRLPLVPAPSFASCWVASSHTTHIVGADRRCLAASLSSAIGCHYNSVLTEGHYNEEAPSQSFVCACSRPDTTMREVQDMRPVLSLA